MTSSAPACGSATTTSVGADAMPAAAAVICAEPIASAVRRPDASTKTLSGALELQTSAPATGAPCASAASAVNERVWPTPVKNTDAWSMATLPLANATTAIVTGSLVTPPLDAVMRAAPAATPVATPLATAATVLSDEAQVKVAPATTRPVRIARLGGRCRGLADGDVIRRQLDHHRGDGWGGQRRAASRRRCRRTPRAPAGRARRQAADAAPVLRRALVSESVSMLPWSLPRGP